MCGATVIILNACITLAIAKDFAANPHSIEKNLIDRVETTPIHDANLDATTFAKPQTATMARPPASLGMNRLPIPMTQGRVGLNSLKWAGTQVNRQKHGKVKANQNDAVIAARYSKSLYELGDEGKEQEGIKAGMESLKLFLKDAPEFKTVMNDPRIPIAQKKKVLDKVLEKGTIKKFCNFLVDKQRINLLANIIEQYETLYNSQTDIEVCEVKSACKLEEDQLFSIAQSVQKKTGAKSVKIQEEIDEALIAGFILTYGGNTIDLSVRTSLNRLRSSLMSASYGR